MKEVRCRTCGAPLSPVKGMGQCRCEYCGSLNLLEQEVASEERHASEESMGIKGRKVVSLEERSAAEGKKVVSLEEKKLAKQEQSLNKGAVRARDSREKEKALKEKALKEKALKEKAGTSREKEGAGLSRLNLFMVIMIVAMLFVSHALNSAVMIV